jgi:hypothetical protein
VKPDCLHRTGSPATRNSGRQLVGVNYCAPRLTRVSSANVLDEGLWIGGKDTTRDSGSKISTRRTQVHVPVVEDRYFLPAI